MPRRVSISAQNIAMARSHLTWLRVVDDPFATCFLHWPWKALGLALRHWPFSVVGRSPAFAYLAARTMFYDERVERALERGIRQVVILAAGYDTRSWRLSSPNVTFFETDLPTTQADKRARAPEGPVYVQVAAFEDPTGPLLAAGLDRSQPAIFTLEGLSMYLPEHEVTDLLTALAVIAAPGSQLAIDFGVGAHGRSAELLLRSLQAATVLFGRLSSERLRFELEPDRAPQMLDACGWRADEVLGGRQLGQRFLTSSGLPRPRERPGAFVVGATRSPAEIDSTPQRPSSKAKDSNGP